MASKPHSELKSFRDLDTETLAKMVYCAIDSPSSVLAERVNGLLEQLETLHRLESAVHNAAINGENEYIRSWCNLALAGAGIESSYPASRSSE